MIAAVDVDYRGEVAVAACVLFPAWESTAPSAEHVATVTRVRDYVPGQFYLRELPALLAVLERIRAPLEAVVIDGYVWLDTRGRPGLGAHLFEALGGKVPVIGVAKRAFAGSAHAVAILRGTSRTPLFVTAAGIDAQRAAEHIHAMAGPHRIPQLLREVDRLARTANARAP